MSTADSVAAVVAGLRATHDDLALPDTCDVIRTTQVSDGRGGTTTTEATVGTYRCSLEDGSSMTGVGEYLAGSIESLDRPYVVTLPYGTDVTEQDKITVGDRRFEVRGVLTGGAYDVATEAITQEVTA